MVDNSDALNSTSFARAIQEQIARNKNQNRNQVPMYANPPADNSDALNSTGFARDIQTSITDRAAANAAQKADAQAYRKMIETENLKKAEMRGAAIQEVSNMLKAALARDYNTNISFGGE